MRRKLEFCGNVCEQNTKDRVAIVMEFWVAFCGLFPILVAAMFGYDVEISVTPKEKI